MRTIMCTNCFSEHTVNLPDGPSTVSTCVSCEANASRERDIPSYTVVLSFRRTDGTEDIATLSADFRAPTLGTGIKDGSMAAALGPAIERLAAHIDIADE